MARVDIRKRIVSIMVVMSMIQHILHSYVVGYKYCRYELAKLNLLMKELITPFRRAAIKAKAHQKDARSKGLQCVQFE